jgi:competence protein ComEA
MSEKNLIKNLIILSFTLVFIIPLGGCSKSDNGLYMELSQAGMDMDTDTSADSLALKEDEPTGIEECKSIYVYVCGAVASPGVYELEFGSRLYEAVDMAGGMNGDADMTYLNMARKLTDGEQIVVYTQSEAAQIKESVVIAEEKSGLVNINTAGISELITISGIGESRAKAIIDYREKNGAFGSIEDIMKVDGIKDGLFSKIKDSITV